VQRFCEALFDGFQRAYHELPGWERIDPYLFKRAADPVEENYKDEPDAKLLLEIVDDAFHKALSTPREQNETEEVKPKKTRRQTVAPAATAGPAACEGAAVPPVAAVVATPIATHRAPRQRQITPGRPPHRRGSADDFGTTPGE